MSTWIVVADSGRARFFAVEESAGQYAGSQYAPSEKMNPMAGALAEFWDMENPQARLPEHDLASDEPGRGLTRGGQGSHAVEQATTPKERDAIEFARNLVKAIEEGHSSGKMTRFYLVAPAHFLGLMRDNLSAGLKACHVGDVDKDLTRMGADEIRAHLPERL